ncbi:MAG: helix-turn-helix domain-containing protein [Clostridiales bacterium]|nr:helix-turn-helix domain-containing protein [Clostridiales bacterium]
MAIIKKIKYLDGSPHVPVNEYMKHRLQNKLIRAILKDSL